MIVVMILFIIYIGYFILEACKKIKIDKKIKKYEEIQFDKKTYEKNNITPKEWYRTIYLKSSHWQELRKTALERAGYKCQVCGKNNIRLNVHHNTYKNIGHEDITDLCVLCEVCHEIFYNGGVVIK